MTTIDNSSNNHLISKLIVVIDEIDRARSLLEAAQLLVKHMDRPGLLRTIDALGATIDTADDILDLARGKVDALCDKYRSPKDKAERRGLPASAKH